MSVDVFGRQWVSEKEIQVGPRGYGFNFTTSGNFDINNKRLCNVGDPIDISDSVNLQFLTKKIEIINKTIDDLSDALDLLKKETVNYTKHMENFKKDTLAAIKRRPSHYRDLSILHHGY